MREPVGSWTVPMMRTAKLVHHRLVVAAEQFVFRPSTPEQALTLQNALRLALLDFERHGILGGAGDAPEARVSAMALPGPTEPALVATVTAFLRPWLRRIHVDLTVRPGVRPQLEVS
jgi:phage tail sheath protein FI